MLKVKTINIHKINNDEQEYLNLCKKLNIVPQNGLPFVVDDDNQILLSILQKNNIPIYNSKQVHKYLKKLAHKKGRYDTEYSWRPLREQDKTIKIKWQYTRKKWGVTEYGLDKKVYSKIIPISVLNTIDIISNECPETGFYISHIKKEKDPFLMVGLHKKEGLIVDFWSEPTFKPRG